MPISDDDLNYLRNTNARPGPNADKSIDPTKPGPDADSTSPEPQNVREAAEDLLIAIGMGWDLDGCAENLRAALAQSDAEPVAWQWRYVGDEEWKTPPGGERQDKYVRSGGRKIEHRPLYAAPPRPDVSKGISISDETLTIEWVIDGKTFGPKSVKVERPNPPSAGLIGALRQIIDIPTSNHRRALEFIRGIAYKVLRSRAADRSGK